MRILCRLGWHKWLSDGNRERHCIRCPRKQFYEFGYTGWDTGAWENVR